MLLTTSRDVPWTKVSRLSQTVFATRAHLGETENGVCVGDGDSSGWHGGRRERVQWEGKTKEGAQLMNASRVVGRLTNGHLGHARPIISKQARCFVFATPPRPDKVHYDYKQSIQAYIAQSLQTILSRTGRCPRFSSGQRMRRNNAPLELCASVEQRFRQASLLPSFLEL